MLDRPRIGAAAASFAPALPRLEIRALLTLAVPIIAGKLAMVGQNTVDVLLAGHLSARVLGAVAMGATVWGMGQMGLTGLMMVVSPFVAQFAGAGKRADIGPFFVQSIWLGLAGGALLLVAVRWGGPALVDVMGVAPELRADVAAFLGAVSLAGPAFGVLLACMGLSEGLSLPRISMAFGIAGLLLLAPIGYALMYGRFGLPALGAAGSGYANALVVWCQALVFLTLIVRSRRFGRLGWEHAPLGPSRGVLLAQIRLGLPIAASQLLETGLFTTAGLLIGGFGTVAAAGHLLALNVGALTFMVPLGIAFATTVRVGLAAGRGDRGAARRSGFAGIGLAASTQSVCALVLLLLPSHIAALYTNDPAVIARATLLLRLAGIFQLSDGVQVAAIAALRGLKDTRVPVALTAVAYWGVGLPVALVCAYPLGLETPGIWCGLIGGLTTAAVLLTLRFRRVSLR